MYTSNRRHLVIHDFVFKIITSVVIFFLRIKVNKQEIKQKISQNCIFCEPSRLYCP